MLPDCRHPQIHPRILITALGEIPSAAELHQAAACIADACAGKRYPSKACGALLRNHGGALAPRVRAQLKQLVEQELEAQRDGSPPVAAVPPLAWLSVQEAATILRLHPSTLAERLRQRDGRRRLGWPQWDGHRWLIAPQAIDPNTSAVFLAKMPEAEPLASLLPDWCER